MRHHLYTNYGKQKSTFETIYIFETTSTFFKPKEIVMRSPKADLPVTYFFGSVLSLFLALSVEAQQAGMRAGSGGVYRFDAEKYKADMGLQRMRQTPVQPYTPAEPKYYSSDIPAKQRSTAQYKPPKFPSDTLAFFVNNFVLVHNVIQSADSLSNAKSVPFSSPILLTGDTKYKSNNIYTLAYNYSDYYGAGTMRDALEKYNYHSNKRTTVWVRKTGGSDKTYLRLDASVEKLRTAENYWLYINNKGEVKVDYIDNGAGKRTIFKTKTTAWQADEINELTVQKLGEKLRFLCNGQEIYSATLEHPWTRMATSLVVDYAAEFTLYSYMHMFYPY